MAVKLEVIDKSGAWFSYNGLRIGQGKDNVRKYLDENPEVSAEIEALVREKAQAAKDGEDEFEGDEDGLDIRLMDDEDEEGQLDLESLGGDDE